MPLGEPKPSTPPIPDTTSIRDVRRIPTVTVVDDDADSSGASSNSAVDRAAAAIRSAILKGSMAPGSSFSINELGQQLGSSHIPVREALRQLEAQGLVRLRPGRRAVVNPLTAGELTGVYRLRGMIEPDLAARSCNLLEEADFAQLEELLEAYQHHQADPNTEWKLHHDIHFGLLRPAASEWDIRILTQLWFVSDRYTRLVFDPYNAGENALRHRYLAHRALLRAARSESPFEIRNAWLEHLRQNETWCLRGIAALRPRQEHSQPDA